MPFIIDCDINEDLIVEACANAHGNLLNKPDVPHGGIRADGVMRYSESMVVKWGYEVTAKEARNQICAQRLLDPRIVRVPKVYHYFERGEDRGHCGYLVMEYIEGEACDTLPTKDKLHRIADVIGHLASHHGDTLGPVGGGESWGWIWEEAVVEFEGIPDFEKYFNDRIFDTYNVLWHPKEWHGAHVEPLRVSQSELVLVHGDIQPRNILWCPDGTLALLDWSVAGFYPRYFEHVAIDWNEDCGVNVPFVDAILECLPLEDHEALAKKKVSHAGFNTMRYRLYPDEPENFLRPPPHQTWGD